MLGASEYREAARVFGASVVWKLFPSCGTWQVYLQAMAILLCIEHIVPQPVFRQGGWHHVFCQGGWLWLSRQVGKSTADNNQQPQ